MSSDTLISLSGVWKQYSLHPIFHRSLREDIVNLLKKQRPTGIDQDHFWALKNIALSLNRGECVGLYGHNGAGKSTILKLIAHVTYPDRGELKIRGRIAPLIEVGAGFHPDLSGRENIFVNGTIIGMTIAEVRDKMEQIVAFAELEKFIDLPIKRYSSGMHLRLGFSIAIHSQADIVILDEILAVGDENFQQKCLSKIRELKARGTTLLLVSHDINRLRQVCDRIITLRQGAIVKEERLNACKETIEQT
jgi:ABC-type polysaccharide/polyol phosphate transport system ATPase subunit